MRKISISDVTLREFSALSGAALSFKEKLSLAQRLDALQLDVIELSPVSDKMADGLLIKTMAPLLKYSVLSAPAGINEADIDTVWSFLSAAKKPRLHIILPVSTVQMEYTLHKKPSAVLSLITDLVTKALSLCEDVEFSAADATRSEESFLISALNAATSAGAKTVTVCDTAGVMLPDEFAAFIGRLYAALPSLKNVTLGAECSDEISMAAANSLSALRCGAGLIKTAIPELKVPRLEEMTHIMLSKGEELGFCIGIIATELHKSLSRMDFFKKETAIKSTAALSTQDENAPITGVSCDEVCDYAKALGYDLSDEDKSKVYEAFCRISEKKKVSRREMERIIAANALQVPPAYKLVSYVINSGSCIAPTACVEIEHEGNSQKGLASGDGPIDAALHAIEQIIGCHYELDDFELHSITEGREAIGEAIIRLRFRGKLYSGRGVSTDIIGAGIRAYLSALNKIEYEIRN